MSLIKQILIGFLILVIQSGFAQKSDVINRWDIKTSYYRTPLLNSSIKMNCIGMDANYRLVKVLDVGIYAGYGRMKMGMSFSEDHYYHQISFGGNTNLHLLPLFLSSEKLRLDFYLSAKLGVNYNSYNSKYYDESDYNFSWGTYFGTAYYFGKHFGLFAEAGYAKFADNAFHMKYGLTFKF